MNGSIDLHIHTSCSDGVNSPSKVLSIAREQKLRAFAIADHDTIDGYRQAKSLIVENDPELIPGLEMSVSFEGGDLHVLAYCFDSTNEALTKALEEFQFRRNERAREMVEKLNGMNIDITYDQVCQVAKGEVIGRPHVAEALYHNGAVESYDIAFARYIGNGKPAYVPKKNFGPDETIATIHQAGGVAVLAHPFLEGSDKHIEMLTGLGLDGLEVFHPYHRQGDIDRLKHLADRYRLIITGGSDFHGREGKYGYIGSQKIPASYLDRLKEKAEENRNTN